MIERDKVSCAGCGLEISWLSSRCVEIAPGRSVRLCAKSRDQTKLACYEAAKKKLHLCDSCGQEMDAHRWRWGRVCDPCAQHGARVRELGAPPELFWVGLRPEELFGRYLSASGVRPGSEEGQAAELAAKLVELLAAVTGGRRQEGRPASRCRGSVPPDARDPSGVFGPSAGCLFVEISEAQIAALRAFGDELHRIGEAQFRLGAQHGGNLLKRLARGEVTVDEYEDRRRRAEGD